jgi:DNA-binding beta-propeller fold protein YncE
MKKTRSVILLLLSLLFFSDGLWSGQSDLLRFEKAKEFFRNGINHYNKMQYLAAVEFFRKAIAVYPDYYSARDYLARSYDLAGFADSALQELSSMKDMYPDDVLVSARMDSVNFRNSLVEEKPAVRGLVHKTTIRSNEMKRFSFARPVDIAVDNEKNIYITSFESGKLIKIDDNGRGVFIRTPALSGKLYGVDVLDDMVAVTDFKNDAVVIYNRKGDVVRSFGSPGSGEGNFHGPHGLCFGEGGYLYVVDSGNSRVQKLNTEGKFILQFGRKGGYEGELSSPTDAALLGRTVYVTDTDNHRLSMFDTSGNFLGQALEKDLSRPRGISVRGQNLLISDENRGLLLYNPATQEKEWFNKWDDDRKFSRLTAALADRDNFIYCLDYSAQTVEIFSPLQKQYSNLDVDIVSVDTSQFPTVAWYVHVRGARRQPRLRPGRQEFQDHRGQRSHTEHPYRLPEEQVKSVSAVLCVDRSSANRRNHKDLQWITDFYLKKMHTNDTVKLINFSGDVWEGNRFDWSRRRTLKAIQNGEYGRGKKMGKAMYNGLTDLVPRLNRRALMVLTDGSVDDDSFDQYSPRTIIHFARSHFIPIYIVSIQEPDGALVEIARQTGGDIIRPGQMVKMRDIYQSIKNSEEYRYVLIYNTLKTGDFRGWWSNVRLEVDYRGMKGLQWGGYFVPEK